MGVKRGRSVPPQKLLGPFGLSWQNFSIVGTATIDSREKEKDNDCLPQEIHTGFKTPFAPGKTPMNGVGVQIPEKQNMHQHPPQQLLFPWLLFLLKGPFPSQVPS